MNQQQSLRTARGVTDAQDRLLTADLPLAELQEGCGGTLPGTLAVPELLELVRQARSLGLRIAREFSAFDGIDRINGFVRVTPLAAEHGEGCELLVENWRRGNSPEPDSQGLTDTLDAVDRAAAEVHGRLDADQQVRYLEAGALDAVGLQEAFAAEPGRVWSEYVRLQGVVHQQPLHWRLLDNMRCSFEGSQRDWRVRLIPIGVQQGSPQGFEWLLVADEPLAPDHADQSRDTPAEHSRLIGSALTPVLRQPIARIIANAETIRARLAGPIRAEYSDYAGSIADAGQHLSGMLDDLADLEVVEAPGFTTARERVDLADAARRAAGILGVRAQRRGITIEVSSPDEPVMAMAEFRRVLQILINLLGNAIAYSPENSTVKVIADHAIQGAVKVSVLDEGPGIEPDQASRIFDKFERLGRDSDGGADSGSGLGLYISRKLALIMGGELEVVQPEDRTIGQEAGAKFRLTLPCAEQA